MDFSAIFSDLSDKLQGWLEAFILMLPNLAAAVLVVVLFVFVARGVRSIVRRVMHSVSSYRTVNNLIATIAYLAVVFAGVSVALGILNLDKTVTSLLAGVGIVGLALGFAFQDIASNFMAGILMSIRRPFGERDIIKSNDFMGTIEEVNLRATVMRTFTGQHVILPNASVFQNPIVNYTRLGKRRVDVGCGVAYGDDLAKAKQVALEAVRGLDGIRKDDPVDLYYTEFGDSSINFTLRFWVDYGKQTDFLGAQSEAIMAIKRAFDEAGITIPFPIRTLDFGVVGGERLDEVLPRRLYENDSGGASPGARATDTAA